MTAECLQNFAIRLGNASWCRHWLHWNHPVQEPWLMAISCLDDRGRPRKLDLESMGFTLGRADLLIYTIPRTDDSGQPYRSRLL